MEKIKSYPLQFTESKLNSIKEKAKSENKTLKQWLYEAIDEKAGE